MTSVGLGQIANKEQLDLILNNASQDPDKKYVLGLFDDDVYVEYFKFYQNTLGLNLRGTLDINEEFTVSNYFPMALSDVSIEVSNLQVITGKNNDDVYAVCEEEETGNEFFFSLQNYLEYMSCDEANLKYSMQLVGLADTGTIVLPIVKEDEEILEEEEQAYKELVTRSRYGDKEADELILQNLIETSQMIQDRLQYEDFLSIVRTYFVPQNEERAEYFILGDIIRCEKIQNKLTEEYVWRLTLEVTGTYMQVFIGEKTVVGLPMVGMRYIGTCWLQGNVEFK